MNMMKKFMCTILSMSILLSMTACNKKEEPSSIVYRYKNDTYSAKWGEAVNGYTEQVKFEVKDDKIKIITYDALDDTGKSIKQDEHLKADMIKYNEEVNLPQTYPEQFMADIIAAFDKAGGNPLIIENVAGATISTNRFKAMIDETLLINAMDGIKTEYIMPIYASGKYKVKMPFITEGWQDYAVVTVKNGKFKVEETDSEDIDGNLKTKDNDLKLAMMKNNRENSLPETYPEKYYPQLMINFENCEGNLEKMNGIAGATQSVDNFKLMMEAVVESAKNRGSRTLTAKKYKDGNYKAKMKDSIKGWTDFVEIKVKDDRVIIIDFDAKDAKGNLKSADLQFKEDMIKANKKKHLPETFPVKYGADIKDEFYKQGFDVTKMENIAGATVSSNNFKLMLGELLRFNAKNGIEDLLIVEALGKDEE